MNKTCKVCSKDFLSINTKQIYCSNKCNHTFHNKQRVFPKEIRNCIICDNEFEMFIGRNKLTCSKECGNRNDNNQRNIRLREQGKIIDVIKICIICDNEFNTTKNYQKKTCSEKCAKENTKRNNLVFCQKRDGIVSKTLICIICNKEFITTRKDGQILACSKKCQYTRIVKDNRKRLENLGLEFKISSMEYQFALMSFNKLVKTILGNSCVICGSTHKLNIHHIFQKIKYPKLSLNTNNGIPLCKNHHLEIHRLN